MRGLAGTQFKIMQQLAGVQREQFKQAVETARNQMQLIGQKREPNELASAQAEMVREYGQQYVDSVNKAVGIVSQALEEYGEQLQKGKNAATDDQQAADTATRGSKEAADSPKSSGKSSAADSTKSSGKSSSK